MIVAEAPLNYLAEGIPSSLHRTGGPKMRRDHSGSDSRLEGVEIARPPVSIHDGREAAARCTLDQHGFALEDARLDDTELDFLASEEVVSRYYADCAERVRVATGAGRVYAFDHNVRSAGGKRAQRRLAQGQKVQAPAHMVHGDYTLTSAVQRLRDLTCPPTANDTYGPLLDGRETLVSIDEAQAATAATGRFALINVWRNIDVAPVRSDPLVLCAAQSVEPEDLVVFEIHYADRVGENYWAKHADRHAWYTFPEMEREEALLIKQWDSAGPLARSNGAAGDASELDSPCTFSFHSAFTDPRTTESDPDRWSCEVRCLALWI